MKMKRQNMCWLALAMVGICLYGIFHVTSNVRPDKEVEMYLDESGEGSRYVGRYYDYTLTLNNTGDNAVSGFLRLIIDLDVDWDNQIELWIDEEPLVFIEADDVYANYYVEIDAGEVIVYDLTFYSAVVVEYDISYVFYVFG